MSWRSEALASPSIRRRSTDAGDPRQAGLAEIGDRVHLDQRVRDHERRHLYERARGAAFAEYPAPYRVYGCAVADAPDEDVHLHDLLETGALGAERRADVLQNTLGLSRDVIAADEPAVAVESQHPRDVQPVAR